MARTLSAGTLLALGTTPILAQRANPDERGNGQRPSRKCVQEIVQVCGTDRSRVRACLAENADALSKRCQRQVRERMGVSDADRPARRPFVAAIRPTRSVLFGDHHRQRIDIYEPKGAVEPLPLVLFIHGGGWTTGDHTRVQAKPQHFTKQDIYFASTGYRLLPDHPVESQASDIGAAIQSLVGQAGLIGFDPSRIILMGHSSGAHLAALVATDPQYAGEAFASIQGVILLDSAGYDVVQHIKDADFVARQVYAGAFGYEVERQKALSPITHIGGPDAPNWLALYSETRAPTEKQANLLVAGLTEAGLTARAVSISGSDHGRMNREIGTPPGEAQTQAIDAFLAEVFD